MAVRRRTMRRMKFRSEFCADADGQLGRRGGWWSNLRMHNFLFFWTMKYKMRMRIFAYSFHGKYRLFEGRMQQQWATLRHRHLWSCWQWLIGLRAHLFCSRVNVANAQSVVAYLIDWTVDVVGAWERFGDKSSRRTPSDECGALRS